MKYTHFFQSVKSKVGYEKEVPPTQILSNYSKIFNSRLKALTFLNFTCRKVFRAKPEKNKNPLNCKNICVWKCNENICTALKPSLSALRDVMRHLELLLYYKNKKKKTKRRINISSVLGWQRVINGFTSTHGMWACAVLCLCCLFLQQQLRMWVCDSCCTDAINVLRVHGCLHFTSVNMIYKHMFKIHIS